MNEFLNTPLFLKAADEYFPELNDDQTLLFEQFAALLTDWNQKINLTAITDPDGMAVLHFADSLSLFRAVKFEKGASVIDVGTGGGFPGIPLAIVRPDLQLTLLDSLQKRLHVLDEIGRALSLSFRTVHARAEEAGRDEKYREKFDIAVSRAVASLPALCEYCLPFVKPGGVFAAMKGQKAAQELLSCETALKKLGGVLETAQPFTLYDGSERTIVVIRKISQTPSQYPRSSAKIAKSPL